MDTQLTAEQKVLEGSCERLLEREWPLERALQLGEGGGEGLVSDFWQHIANAGWLSLAFPEDVGGAGGSLVDLGIVYRSAGYRLIPSRFYSDLFGAFVIFHLGTQSQRRLYLPPVLDGSSLITVAYCEPNVETADCFFTATARRSGNGWIFGGTKTFVPHLDTADYVIVFAQVNEPFSARGLGAFILPRNSLKQVRRQSTFAGERFFTLSLEGVSASNDALLGEATGPIVRQKLSHVLEVATGLQAMEAVGGIRAILERTIEYTKGRSVFGRPIAANQSVQHMLTDLSIRLRGAEVAAAQAIFLKGEGRLAAREVAIAKFAACELYQDTSRVAHQLWGAMGYARESGLYLWSERARVIELQFGGRQFQLEKLSAAMGL